MNSSLPDKKKKLKNTCHSTIIPVVRPNAHSYMLALKASESYNNNNNKKSAVLYSMCGPV